eukprot:83269-Pyramimonas_sp.AAC.1
MSVNFPPRRRIIQRSTTGAAVRYYCLTGESPALVVDRGYDGGGQRQLCLVRFVDGSRGPLMRAAAAHRRQERREAWRGGGGGFCTFGWVLWLQCATGCTVPLAALCHWLALLVPSRQQPERRRLFSHRSLEEAHSIGRIRLAGQGSLADLEGGAWDEGTPPPPAGSRTAEGGGEPKSADDSVPADSDWTADGDATTGRARRA